MLKNVCVAFSALVLPLFPAGFCTAVFEVVGITIGKLNFVLKLTPIFLK